MNTFSTLKFVLSFLPLYYMSVFLLPQGVARVLTSIQRRFLWGSVSHGEKLCKVAWNVVIRETNRGGLGEGFYKTKTKIILWLFRWLWRLGDNNPGGWKYFIRTAYRPKIEISYGWFCKKEYAQEVPCCVEF